MSNNNPKKPAGKNPMESGPAASKGGPPSKPPAGPVEPVPQPVTPPLFRKIDWVTFGITTLVVLTGYLLTLSPDLTLQDSGELAVGSFYAGVPHPPGYPVWTIYTWFFTQFLPISNIAFRVSVSSAVAGALGCGFIALMVSRGSSMMIEGIAELKAIERRWENALCVVSGFVAGMLLGFNGFMWSQAVIVEVYPLSVLSLSGVMVCLLRWIYAPHQRRYLYLAFFFYGICFNNHQSLLVIALGLEVAILTVQPKLGRDLFFWNSIICIGGLVAKEMGMMSVLQDNDPLLWHYVGIGAVSISAWMVLVAKTRKDGWIDAGLGCILLGVCLVSLLLPPSATKVPLVAFGLLSVVWLAVLAVYKRVEMGRDLAMVASLAYLLALFGHITSFVTIFHRGGDITRLKLGLFILFNLGGLGCIALFIYLIKAARAEGRNWVSALICGATWAVGAAFYLYMPLASMSNPPLNWGYPRTVTGFFHAFTRGQYERIHPTLFQSWQGHSWQDYNWWGLRRYFEQFYYTMVEGTLEEFNFAYLLIAVVVFLFYRRMQKRERAWVIGLAAIYITLGPFLLDLLSPAPDRQSQDLNKVFFTASHVMLSMFIGYGLTIIGSLLVTQYERWRKWALLASALAAGLALVWVVYVLDKTPNPLQRDTAYVGLALALFATGALWLARQRAPMAALVTAFALMPIYSIMSHWEDNEQHGHLFGYWFGHDMFTPPFKGADGKPLYPEMDRDTVLFGGTDPGRFNPTYMIFCESFIPPSKKPHDPNFDRRDVYLITQNALADGTYLNYIRAHYNRSTQPDPPFFTELFRGPTELGSNFKTNIVARAVAPIDKFFLKLGDDIEKRRRAGSSLFKEADFIDLPSFTAKLQKHDDPVSRYVFDNLSKGTQDLLSRGGDQPSLRRALAKDLNQILENDYEGKTAPLYTADRFKGVNLSDHAARFIKENPKSHTRIRWSRLLLESAYPTEIAKSIGGVYPDLEIHTPSNDDSQRCFQDYLGDAQRRLDHDRRLPNEPRQLKPGEDVKIVENRVQVSGQVAVMAINGLLTKIIFEQNPDHEFYVEESFPLDWMYPYLSPYGIIMKINRQPIPEMTEDMVSRDHEFWSQFSQRLIGNWITYDTSVSNICAFAEKIYHRRDYKDFHGDPKFIRDNDGQKAFSKLRSSIAGLYSWRVGFTKNPVEQQRLIKEAEFSFKQAYAFCPYSPEALFRYINLLVGMGRIDDARIMAKTSLKLDPNNGQIEGLVVQLDQMRAQQGNIVPQPQPGAQPTIVAAIPELEKQVAADPANMQASLRLLSTYVQAQQNQKALDLADKLMANPQADTNTILFVAQMCNQMSQLPRVEKALGLLVKLSPESPETWFDLAGFQALNGKTTESITSLRTSLQLSARRRVQNTNAPNLIDNAGTDPRFNALRQNPEFVKLMAEVKPAAK